MMKLTPLLLSAGLLLCQPVRAADPSSHSHPAATVSLLETIDIESGRRTVVLQTPEHIEAPNWSRDGLSLIVNKGGLLYRIPVQGGELQRIDTGSAVKCNNDHGISPDGTLLAISDSTRPGGSQVYVLPITGGEPRPITQPGAGSSYWHGWSPDGRTLAFDGERNRDFDIYAIPATGGKEVRLTTSPGKDDAPDYSADGTHIFYNSYQTGRMQIWRIDADGANPTQLTFDAYSNWFPHPSPDGKWIVYLSYVQDQRDAHPPGKEVMLQLMPVESGKSRVLAKFTGGQGTINVPSWAPDSRCFAFVSYPAVPSAVDAASKVAP